MSVDTKFGLDDKTISVIREILSKYPVIKKAAIFGSRANNTYKPTSDIDLVVWYDGKSDVINKLRVDFEDSLIPYFFDVVDYIKIKDEKLRKVIDNEAKVFYIPILRP